MAAVPKVTIRKIARYGWIPDIPDHRDYRYGVLRKLPASLPSSVDLRPTCPAVADQGNLGSCTANALAGAMEFLMLKDQKPYADLSRLFIYYDERVIEGTVDQDSGAMIRDGIKTLADQGVCTETLWPYDISQFAVKPADACYQEALNYKITLYARLNVIDEMRASLADGFPFVFGFTVYESFESQDVANTGVVPMPGTDEQVLGGHAVVGVGYDDSQQRFIVRNSWGDAWGMKGYFTIPYDYLANRDLSDDFWAIRAGGQM
ncbi:MAG TPA: C1 family peptidase [Syntrophorhabdales bacterium]|nr:C1 family peptidase [Syntrophorhabdales bacterium]